VKLQKMLRFHGEILFIVNSYKKLPMLNTNIPYFENLSKFYEAISVPKPIHEHFDVRFIQENLKTVKMHMPPFRNPCFMISMTLKGQGSVHHAGTEAFRVGDLSVFFTAPGQLQSWDVLPDWEGVYVIFSKEFFAVNRIILEEIRESPFFDIDNRVSLTLVPEEAEVLLDLFEKIKTEANNKYENRYEFVKSYIRLMVMYLNRFYEKRIQNNQKPNPQASGILTVREFQDLIEQNLKTDKKLKSVSGFADRLNTHPNHLNALCKEILGKTASELLHDSTLLQAKSLILNSDFSMKEIAYQLGYDEPNYFFRFFKKHIGVTPSEFKKNL
jgi:AraC family transcriptional regulator, transcriptional activator of pobA